MQVKVPKTYEALTARRVLTSEWLDGEKLSQSTADDVGSLVNLGVICYLKQLLQTGFFHAGIVTCFMVLFKACHLLIVTSLVMLSWIESGDASESSPQNLKQART